MDFILKAKDTFSKGWDRARIQLEERTLFSSEALPLQRVAIARLEPSQDILTAGQRVVVYAAGDQLLVLRDVYPVGYLVNVPAEVVAKVGEHGGYLNGEVSRAYSELHCVEVALW